MTKPERSHLNSSNQKLLAFERRKDRILPVIEDLGAQDVPPDAPDEIVVLLTQPLVSQRLDVKVMDFEARVMDMVLGAWKCASVS